MKSMTYKKECLYDVSWQVLRISLLAENNDYGGFGTRDGVLTNIKVLDAYVYKPASPAQETAERSWRVMNLYAAVLLGYGAKEKFTEQAELVKAAHTQIRSLYDLALTCGANFKGEWDWDQVKFDIISLRRENGKVFDDLGVNLRRREETANRKEANGTGGMAFRPELQKFMDLMLDAEIVAGNQIMAEK